MAHINYFENALDKLFTKRTYWLRSAIGSKKTGPPPKITRKLLMMELFVYKKLPQKLQQINQPKQNQTNILTEKEHGILKAMGFLKKRFCLKNGTKIIFQNKRTAFMFFGGRINVFMSEEQLMGVAAHHRTLLSSGLNMQNELTFTHQHRQAKHRSLNASRYIVLSRFETSINQQQRNGRKNALCVPYTKISKVNYEQFLN